MMKVAIVGSGPAGMFCAQRLLKLNPATRISILEARKLPFGLARYGIAPDHGEAKVKIVEINKSL